MNGTNASATVIGTYPSATVVRTCTAIRQMQKSERFRCRPWETKRGQRGEFHPTVDTSPSTTVADKSTRATSPVERVRYQNAVVPWPTVAAIGVISPPRP